MILMEIRDYVRRHGRAALPDMAVHFDMAPDALRSALQRWIARGQVRQLPTGTPCRGCRLCDPAQVELYEWVGDSKRSAHPARATYGPA